MSRFRSLKFTVVPLALVASFSLSTAQTVQLGWSEFATLGGAEEVALPNVTGTVSGGRDFQTNAGSNDLTWGSSAVPATPPDATGRFRVRTLAGEETVVVTINNGAGAADLTLDRLVFDYNGFSNAPMQLDVTYSAGSLTDTVGKRIAAGLVLDVSASSIGGDFPDYEILLGLALTDLTLGASEFAEFTLVFSDALSENSAGALDNMAFISTAAIPEPAAFGLLAGLLVIGGIALRRRRG